ncbi:hypothetical protein BGZ65_005442, partial [Modicella reniformis]
MRQAADDWRQQPNDALRREFAHFELQQYKSIEARAIRAGCIPKYEDTTSLVQNDGTTPLGPNENQNQAAAKGNVEFFRVDLKRLPMR